MLLKDKEVLSLIKAAFDSDTDVFITPDTLPDEADLSAVQQKLGEKILCLLPGKIFTENTGDTPLIFTDVRELYSEKTEVLLQTKAVRTLIVLFAECAFEWEYGFRRSFGLLGEIRAMLPFSLHICAVFSMSNPPSDYRRFADITGSKAFTVVGENRITPPRVYRCLHQKDTVSKIASFLYKDGLHNAVVYSSTRRQAEEFYRYMYKRGEKCLPVHGGMSDKENTDAFIRFQNGSVTVLACTKSALPTLWKLKADTVYICGIPYSLSHYKRLISVAKEPKTTPVVVFSPDDILQNIKITNALWNGFPEDVCKQLTERRLQDIKQLLDYLERNR